MIDTDKYEGHTEGPWEIIEWEFPNPQWDVMLSCPEVGKFASIQGCNRYRPTEVDVELIADAPLLLAEVKQLRGEPEVNCCPTCGSSDITIYDSFVDSGSHKVSCEADGCESRWFEIWRHVGIEMIEGDDNR